VAAGAEVAEAIAEIMGVKVEAKEPDIARPGCYFGVQDADLKYIYNGLDDCRAVALLGGGMKVCTIGCLGLGTCEKVCPFNAITMGPQGLPVVDQKNCTGCGTCERVCPKHIINLSSVTRRIMREYTTEECTTPCQRSCPAGIDIREYIRQISLGNFHRSVQVIKERNPFPAIIGRICPRPCELDCRRNFIDEPVAINYLKRFAADFERESGERILPYRAPPSGRSIAVVGGGVEGLSTAFFAARLGHRVTVYDANPKLGGLLRSAIAKERLPEEILDWDIEGILEIGVAAETGKVMGKDFTVDALLRQDVDAVFLAAGGWDSRMARKTAPSAMPM
jgi:Na+-translocating ferredoxin:NAD+ oxidoreductase RNF subunit RnfB